MVQRRFSIDTRALAVFRICVALLLIWDLLDRWGVCSCPEAREASRGWLAGHTKSYWQLDVFFCHLSGCADATVHEGERQASFVKENSDGRVYA